VLLHLCQPIEPGIEELGKAKPNAGVMYPRTDQVSRLSLSLVHVQRLRRSLEGV
jgi:hypothetical protein